MSKLVRLSPTNIEYAINPDGSRGYAWNPYGGCLHGVDVCPVSPHCWAKRHTQRFKSHYPNGFAPTVYPDALMSPFHLKKPSRILVSFMGDLFGDWVHPNEPIGYHEIEVIGGIPIHRFGTEFSGKSLLKIIFTVIRGCPQHTFIFLTKNPKGLLRWSPFPSNCYVGVSVCNQKMFNEAVAILSGVNAKHTWLSIEPLLGEIHIKPVDLINAGINWVIIGAQSNPVSYPEVDWVEEIVDRCRCAGIPYWEKNNLRPLLGNNLIQNLPR